MPDSQITCHPIASLAPWARNARTHSKKQIRQIADSIVQFGFTNPVLIDEAGTILAGHGHCQTNWTGLVEPTIKHPQAAN